MLSVIFLASPSSIIDPYQVVYLGDLDNQKTASYNYYMELAEKHSGNENGRLKIAVRKRDYLLLFHPAILLLISFVTAAAVFLSGAELRVAFGSEVAIFKLLAGTALLFFVGIHFTQKLANRRERADALMTYKRNASELASIKQALKAHIASEGR